MDISCTNKDYRFPRKYRDYLIWIASQWTAQKDSNRLYGSMNKLVG